MRRSPPAGSDPVELQHPDRVAPQDLVRLLLVEARVRDHLLDVGLGVGPRRVGVWVVGLEADVVDPDLVEVRKPHAVGGEATEYFPTWGAVS